MQELGRLLSEPLQPRFSTRYFTGHPSALLTARPSAISDNPQSQSPSQPQSNPKSQPDLNHVSGEGQPPVSAVAQAVALAKELAASRKAAAAQASKV